jgi:hypothetical protein
VARQKSEVLRNMPARFLTAEQRRCYGTFPDELSADALARHFHLDATDHIVIQDLRGLQNRLGFAVQLGTVRLLGRFPDRFTDLTLGVIRAAESQLGGDFSESARRAYEDGRQRWRHVAIITQRYGFRRFEDDGPARFRLTRWLYALCWTGEDRPIVLFDRAVPWLIANKVLLPGVTTLERLVGRICDRVERRQWRLLVGSLRPAQQRRIDQLFVPENPDALATLDTLRATPARRAPTELVRHLERLRAIKAFDLRPTPPTGIPAAVLERLARVARRSKPSAIAAIQQPRRTAIIVALFLSLEAMAQDDAAELADTLLADLFRTAEHERKAEQLVGLPTLEEAALVLRGMGEMVLSEDALPLTEWRAALFAKIPRDAIDAAMRHIAGLAKPRDQKPFAQLRARWRRARGIFSQVANGLVIDATLGGKPVWEAMRYLSQRTDWTKPMRDAPTAAITKPWRRHVLGADGKVSDPKAYVFAIMDGWRGALKRRDVFVEPGIRYGDPRRGLLDDKTWEASRAMVCACLRWPGATSTSSADTTSRSPNPSPRANSDPCETLIPNTTFEKPYDSRPAQSAARPLNRNLWASPSPARGRGRAACYALRARSRRAYPPRGRAVSALTGDARFCNRSPAVKPLRISAPAPGPVIYDGTLARRPLPRSGQQTVTIAPTNGEVLRSCGNYANVARPTAGGSTNRVARAPRANLNATVGVDCRPPAAGGISCRLSRSTLFLSGRIIFLGRAQVRSIARSKVGRGGDKHA